MTLAGDAPHRGGFIPQRASQKIDPDCGTEGLYRQESHCADQTTLNAEESMFGVVNES
jgi:hypothetical protein